MKIYLFIFSNFLTKKPPQKKVVSAAYSGGNSLFILFYQNPDVQPLNVVSAGEYALNFCPAFLADYDAVQDREPLCALRCYDVRPARNLAGDCLNPSYQVKD